jgi:hypothetical protein
VESYLLFFRPCRYHWADSFRSSTTSNEARQKLLEQMSSKIQRNVGRKAIEMGGNAVLGYHMDVDLEGETGIVVRAYGSACYIDASAASSLSASQQMLNIAVSSAASAANSPPPFAHIATPLTLSPGASEKFRVGLLGELVDEKNSDGSSAGAGGGGSGGDVVDRGGNGAAADNRKVRGDAVGGDDISGEDAAAAPSDAAGASEEAAGAHDSSSSGAGLAVLVDAVAGAGSGEAGAGGGAGGVAADGGDVGGQLDLEGEPMKIRWNSDIQLLSITVVPSSLRVSLGGIVSARAIKLFDGRSLSVPNRQKARDLWWAEVRKEIRSHARALNCNFVLGYSETTSVYEDICILCATGTAARGFWVPTGGCFCQFPPLPFLKSCCGFKAVTAATL